MYKTRHICLDGPGKQMQIWLVQLSGEKKIIAQRMEKKKRSCLKFATSHVGVIIKVRKCSDRVRKENGIQPTLLITLIPPSIE